MNKNERYTEYYRILKKHKQEQTKEKLNKYGYMDEDDYAYIIPSEEYSFKPEPTHPDGDFYGYTGWGKNFRKMLESFPPFIDKYSALAGNIYCFLNRKKKNEWNCNYDYSHLEPIFEKYNIFHGIGSVQHFCGDVRIGLEIGWAGLLRKVRHYKELRAVDKESEEFYQAEENAILGIQNWIRHHVEKLETMISCEEDPAIKKNLTEMLDVNLHLINNTPRTLREACQFLAWYNMAGRSYNREGAGGQLDELLRPYYEKDIREGRIDDEDAVFFISGLILADTKYYQLGGTGPDGKDMTSPVSYLILEAVSRLNVSANMTIRVHEELDEEFYKKSVECLFKNKNALLRYSGDRALTEGFMKNGYPVELARERIAVGCNWMAIPGLEYCINDCIKINIAKVFEVALYDMMDTENVYSLDMLMQYFEKHLVCAVDAVAEGIDFHLCYNKYNNPELFLNLFCYGPIEKGKDASNGGVKYYNIAVDGVGIAIVADSFAALEQQVVLNKALNWDEVRNALQTNFNGDAGERIQLLLKSSPKYGQSGTIGDDWAVKVSRLFTKIVKEKKTPGGVNMIPGWFSWSLTIEFGKKLGATPDGRKAGKPVNHGANPMPGVRKDGAVTAMSTAIASVQCGYGNTCPFQLDLDPGLTKAQGGVEKIACLIRTHFKLGGTLININILDAEKIRKAHMNPELFPDLMVRVTGFTAYFISLSPDFRQLVVERLINSA